MIRDLFRLESRSPSPQPSPPGRERSRWRGWELRAPLVPSPLHSALHEDAGPTELAQIHSRRSSISPSLGGEGRGELSPNPGSRVELQNRSAAVSQTSRSRFKSAAAGFQPSRAPVLGEGEPIIHFIPSFLATRELTPRRQDAKTQGTEKVFCRAPLRLCLFAMNLFLLAALPLLSGCATTPEHHVTLTGDILECGGKRSATPLWNGGAS